jgi:hypothetical protein
MLPYFIGTANTLVENHLGALPEPEAPSNYKDETKIREAIAAKRQKQRESVGNYPFYGRLTAIVVLGCTGKLLLQKVINTDSDAAAVIEFLNTSFMEDRNSDSWTTNIAAYGFNIQDRMRQLATMGAKLSIPLNPYFWYHDHMSERNVVDPFDYILKKEHQENLPPWRLAEYIGLPVPSTLHTDVARQAQYAYELVSRFGIPE